jgi:hypothetical protein
MKPMLTVIIALALATGVQASEVYQTRDAQGQRVYTDKPATLPAEKLDVKTAATDTVEVQQRYSEQMKRYSDSDKARADAAARAAEAARAKELTADDRAKRCQQARDQYQSYMNARRLFEPGATEGERRYLDDAEIDAARARAKQTMEEFCGGN